MQPSKEGNSAMCSNMMSLEDIKPVIKKQILYDSTIMSI